MRDERTGPVPQSVSVLDFLKMDLPPRRWLVEELIQERDITMVHAWRGVGKTHFVGHLAWAVASGTPFLRYTVPQPAGVLLIDGEMPQEDLQNRFATCANSYGLELQAPLRLLCADALSDSIPSLATPAGQDVIEAELDAFPDVRLLILDSVSTLCNGGAENEAESWTAMQDWLLKLRRLGVSPLIVHHDGKGGKQRGTSKREDVLSQSIHLKQPDDYNPSQGARFQVVLEKARGVYGANAEPYEAQLVEELDGRVTWELKGVEMGSSEKLLSLLLDGVPMREAYKEAGVSRATAYRLRKKWQQEGKLAQEDDNRPVSSLGLLRCET